MFILYQVGNIVIFLYRDEPHEPIQSKPHWFDLDWFRWLFKNQLNQTKPNTFYLAVRMNFMLKTKSNRTTNTLGASTYILVATPPHTAIIDIFTFVYLYYII
jgi:hypothetical protein